jgi:predicted ATPase
MPDALDFITIKGFKSIASVEKLELRPINVLIGANGSGKSNFIGVFAFLRELREGRLPQYAMVAGGAEKVLHFGSKTTREINCHLSLGRRAYDYHLIVKPTADDGLFRAHEEFGHSGQASAVDGVYDRLDRMRFYHLHDTSSTSPMRKTAEVHDNRFLRPDAANLPAYLYYLRERRVESYRLIERAVQRVAPFFDEFRLEPLRLNPDNIKLEWRHKRSDQYFDASSLSDGTLRFIALATLFLQPEEDPPSLILVDEPELGLHPYAIEVLAALVRQASVSTQVILSTQSSLLLDHFDPQDVIVADLEDGSTRLRRLEADRLTSWLETYSLGQLWEKNELGGRPAPG